MGPKRQRAEGSSSRTSFDRKKFVSAEAADKFEMDLSSRALVPERGLRPAVQDGDLDRMIRERGWETFTDHPDAAVTSVVKEFFANIEDSPECEVMVRGKMVSFSRATINDYYNLRGHNPCPYTNWAQNPQYDRIVTDLCKPHTAWTRNAHDGRYKSFPFKSLSRYGKIWYAFLCAKMMPSTHVSDVSADRAKLLYAIITGLEIDVGGVIVASIKRAIQGAPNFGLPHPSLITGLCKRAGVKWGAAEPLQMPTTLLDHNLIRRYQVWSGGRSHPRGLGFLPTDTTDVPSAAAPSSSTAPAALPPSPSTAAPLPDISLQPLQDQLETIQRRLARRRRVDRQRYRRTSDAHSVVAQRQAEMHAYNVQTNTAWLQLFSNLHPGVDTSAFPIPPTLTVYPPPENSDDMESLDTDESSEEDEDPAA